MIAAHVGEDNLHHLTDTGPDVASIDSDRTAVAMSSRRRLGNEREAGVCLWRAGTGTLG